MTPHMAHGAAVAIKNAVILARCLEGVDTDGLEQAFGRHEQIRKGPTSQMHLTCRPKGFMSEQTDPNWVCGRCLADSNRAVLRCRSLGALMGLRAIATGLARGGSPTLPSRVLRPGPRSPKVSTAISQRKATGRTGREVRPV
jgi:2-polyprenyl-6-methoxyphenol hydroxylase-like FAD-dependent oxidoreductase